MVFPSQIAIRQEYFGEISLLNSTSNIEWKMEKSENNMRLMRRSIEFTNTTNGPWLNPNQRLEQK